MSLILGENLLNEYNKRKNTQDGSLNDVERTALGTWSYVNKYDALYDKYNFNKNFNAQMWQDAFKYGDQDTFFTFVEANKDKELSEEFYDEQYYDYETMMLEMSSSVADNTDASRQERFKQQYDVVKNEWLDVSLGEMTDQEYINYQIDQAHKLKAEEIKRAQEIKQKEALGWWGQFGNDIVATLAELGEGALSIVAGIVDFAIATGTFGLMPWAIEGGGDYGEAFVNYFGENGLTALEQNTVRAGLDEYERTHTHYKDIDGNTTDVGKWFASTANSIGMMIPAIIISACTAGIGGGILGSIAFYTGIFSKNMYEVDNNPLTAGSPAWLKITNSTMKVAAEAAIEFALGKLMGGTIQNSLIGIAGKFKTGAVNALAKNLKTAGIKYLAKSAFQEGLEEFVQDFSTNLIDQFSDLVYKGYGNNGVTMQTLVDSFLMGTLCSIVTSGASVPMSAIKSGIINAKAKKSGKYNTDLGFGPGDVVIEVDGKPQKLRGFTKMAFNEVLSDLGKEIEGLSKNKFTKEEDFEKAKEVYTALMTLQQFYGSFDKKRIENCELLLGRVMEAERKLQNMPNMLSGVEGEQRIQSIMAERSTAETTDDIRTDREISETNNVVPRMSSQPNTVNNTDLSIIGSRVTVNQDFNAVSTSTNPSVAGMTRNKLKYEQQIKVQKEVGKFNYVSSIVQQFKDMTGLVGERLAKKVEKSVEENKEKLQEAKVTEITAAKEGTENKPIDPKKINEGFYEKMGNKPLSNTAKDKLAVLADEFNIVLATDGNDIVVDDVEKIVYVPVDWLENYKSSEIYDALVQSQVLDFFVSSKDKEMVAFRKDILEVVRKMKGKKTMSTTDALMEFLFNQSVFQYFILSKSGDTLNIHKHKTVLNRFYVLIEGKIQTSKWYKQLFKGNPSQKRINMTNKLLSKIKENIQIPILKAIVNFNMERTDFHADYILNDKQKEFLQELNRRKKEKANFVSKGTLPSAYEKNTQDLIVDDIFDYIVHDEKGYLYKPDDYDVYDVRTDFYRESIRKGLSEDADEFERLTAFAMLKLANENVYKHNENVPDAIYNKIFTRYSCRYKPCMSLLEYMCSHIGESINMHDIDGHLSDRNIIVNDENILMVLKELFKTIRDIRNSKIFIDITDDISKYRIIDYRTGEIVKEDATPLEMARYILANQDYIFNTIENHYNYVINRYEEQYRSHSKSFVVPLHENVFFDTLSMSEQQMISDIYAEFKSEFGIDANIDLDLEYLPVHIRRRIIDGAKQYGIQIPENNSIGYYRQIGRFVRKWFESRLEDTDFSVALLHDNDYDPFATPDEDKLHSNVQIFFDTFDDKKIHEYLNRIDIIKKLIGNYDKVSYGKKLLITQNIERFVENPNESTYSILRKNILSIFDNMIAERGVPVYHRVIIQKKIPAEKLLKDDLSISFMIDDMSEGAIFTLSDILKVDIKGAKDVIIAFKEMPVFLNGQYDSDENTISINSKLSTDKKKFLSTLVHEINHHIQDMYGLAPGGSSKRISYEFVDYIIKHHYPLVRWYVNRADGIDISKNITPKEYNKCADTLAHIAYVLLDGEVHAEYHQHNPRVAEGYKLVKFQHVTIAVTPDGSVIRDVYPYISNSKQKSMDIKSSSTKLAPDFYQDEDYLFQFKEILNARRTGQTTDRFHHQLSIYSESTYELCRRILGTQCDIKAYDAAIDDIIKNPELYLNAEMLEELDGDYGEGYVYNKLKKFYESLEIGVSIDRRVFEDGTHRYDFVSDYAFDDTLRSDIKEKRSTKDSDLIQTSAKYIYNSLSDYYDADVLEDLNIPDIPVIVHKNVNTEFVDNDRFGTAITINANETISNEEFLNRLNHEFRHYLQYRNDFEMGFTAAFKPSAAMMKDVEAHVPELFEDEDLRKMAENASDVRNGKKTWKEHLVSLFVYYLTHGEIQAYGIMPSLLFTKTIYVEKDGGKYYVHMPWYDAKTRKGRHEVTGFVSKHEDEGKIATNKVVIKSKEEIKAQFEIDEKVNQKRIEIMQDLILNDEVFKEYRNSSPEVIDKELAKFENKKKLTEDEQKTHKNLVHMKNLFSKVNKDLEEYEASLKEPKKTEPKKTEPKKTEPKKTEPKKTEPKKTESKETKIINPTPKTEKDLLIDEIMKSKYTISTREIDVSYDYETLLKKIKDAEKRFKKLNEKGQPITKRMSDNYKKLVKKKTDFDNKIKTMSNYRAQLENLDVSRLREIRNESLISATGTTQENIIRIITLDYVQQEINSIKDDNMRDVLNTTQNLDKKKQSAENLLKRGRRNKDTGKYSPVSEKERKKLLLRIELTDKAKVVLDKIWQKAKTYQNDLKKMSAEELIAIYDTIDTDKVKSRNVSIPQIDTDKKTFSKRRKVNKEEAEGTNLQYAYKKHDILQMPPELIEFIKATTGKEKILPPELIKAIKEDNLNATTFKRWIREVDLDTLTEEAFQLINEHIFKNPYIDTLEKFKKLASIDPDIYWAYISVLNEGANLQAMDLLKRKSVDEFVNTLENDMTYAEYRKKIDAKRKEFFTVSYRNEVETRDKQGNVIDTKPVYLKVTMDKDDIDKLRNYIRYNLLEHFDGSLSSAFYIGNLQRKLYSEYTSEKEYRNKNIISLEQGLGKNGDWGDNENIIGETISDDNIISGSDTVGNSILALYRKEVNTAKENMIAVISETKKKVLLNAAIKHVCNILKITDSKKAVIIRKYFENIEEVRDNVEGLEIKSNVRDLTAKENTLLKIYTLVINTDDRMQQEIDAFDLKLLNSADNVIENMYNKIMANQTINVVKEPKIEETDKETTIDRINIVSNMKRYAEDVIKYLNTGRISYKTLPDEIKLLIAEVLENGKYKYELKKSAYAVREVKEEFIPEGLQNKVRLAVIDDNTERYILKSGVNYNRVTEFKDYFERVKRNGKNIWALKNKEDVISLNKKYKYDIGRIDYIPLHGLDNKKKNQYQKETARIYDNMVALRTLKQTIEAIDRNMKRQVAEMVKRGEKLTNKTELDTTKVEERLAKKQEKEARLREMHSDSETKAREMAKVQRKFKEANTGEPEEKYVTEFEVKRKKRKYERTDTPNNFVIHSNVAMPAVLEDIFDTSFNEFADTMVQFASKDEEGNLYSKENTDADTWESRVQHEVSNWDAFYDAVHDKLSDLTRADVDRILDFFRAGITISLGGPINKLQAYTVFILGYIVDTARNYPARWNMTTQEINNLEHEYEIMASAFGSGLNAVGQMKNVINPFRKVEQRYFEEFNIPEADINNFFTAAARLQDDTLQPKDRDNAIKELRAQIKRMEKLMQDNWLKERGWGKRVLAKINSWRYLSMLSSPFTWARNLITNILITPANSFADTIASKGLLGKIPYREDLGQVNLAKVKVSDDVAAFVKENFMKKTKYEGTGKNRKVVEEGSIFEDILDNTGNRYDLDESTYTIKNGRKSEQRQLLIQVISSAMEQKFAAENRWDNKIMNGVQMFVNEMISDKAFIRYVFSKYFGKMLQLEVDAGNINLKDDAFSEKVLSLFADAIILANYDYMHKGNAFSKIMSTLQKTNPNTYEAIKVLFPFVSSGWNWFVESLKYSLPGLITSIVRWTRLEKEVAKVETARANNQKVPASRFTEYLIRRDVGKGVIGTILFIGGIFLGAFGIIRLDDEDEKLYLYAGENLKVDISSIFGSSSILVGASIGQSAWKDKNKKEMSFDSVMALVTDNFLAGFFLFDTLETYSFDDDNWARSTAVFESYMKSFVPQMWQFIVRASNDKKIKYSAGFAGMWERWLNSFVPLQPLGSRKTNIYTGKEETKYAIPVLGEFLKSGIFGAKIIYHEVTEQELLVEEYGLSKLELSGEITIDGKKYGINKAAVNKYYGELNKDTLLDLQKQTHYVQNENGTYSTLHWNKLTDKQRKTVIDRTMRKNADYAKIYVWTQSGGKYYASDSTFVTLRQMGITKNVYRGDKGFVR